MERLKAKAITTQATAEKLTHQFQEKEKDLNVAFLPDAMPITADGKALKKIEC